MIKLINVGKTYTSKSKAKVEALKDVNFELSASGMTFILGKSGSGKSTLLNLLGGLDKPTVGDIQIDGESMQSFSQSDYESYRNSCVGFVFQEYNLLDDFNVKENVALALQLSKETDINQKVADALAQVGLDEQYLTRRVGELSGGEKQRVAIARALIKDSKMILADEPTGNLDSETGESIWNILKNLSETRLVVVVSHDRESAEKYADRIIEIADGKLIADNGAEQATAPTERQKFTPVKQKLSFLTCLKMGFNSLFKHKARSISVILVSVFTVCALLVSQIVMVYLPERSVAKQIRKNELPYFTLAQGYEKNLHDLFEPQGIYSQGGNVKNLSTLQYVKKHAKTMEWGIVDSKQQILDFGFEFIGEALELDTQSFYLSQDEYERIKEEVSGREINTVIIDGNEEMLYLSRRPVEQLIGCQVRIGSNDYKYYKLAGIIKSVNIELPPIFSLEKFPGGRRTSVNVNFDEAKNVYYKFNDVKSDDGLRIDSKFFASDTYVITKDGILDLARNDFKINKGEVVINIPLYCKMLDGKKLSEYVTLQNNKYELLQVPPIIGQTISFEVNDHETEQFLTAVDSLKVVGVVFDGRDTEDNEMYLNYDEFSHLYRYLNRDGIIVKTDTVKNLSSFLVNLRTKHMGYVLDIGSTLDTEGRVSNISENIYLCENIHEYSIIMLSICAVLVLVMILLVISLISFSINNRKKEIGILSAIGASAGDITKIFILETLIISLMIFVLGLIGIACLVAIFNAVFSRIFQLTTSLIFFVIDPYAILTLFGVCFVLIPLFAFLPTIRIAKLKPIDAIRVL